MYSPSKPGLTDALFLSRCIGVQCISRAARLNGLSGATGRGKWGMQHEYKRSGPGCTSSLTLAALWTAPSSASLNCSQTGFYQSCRAARRLHGGVGESFVAEKTGGVTSPQWLVILITILCAFGRVAHSNQSILRACFKPPCVGKYTMALLRPRPSSSWRSPPCSHQRRQVQSPGGHCVRTQPPAIENARMLWRRRGRVGAACRRPTVGLGRAEPAPPGPSSCTRTSCLLLPPTPAS